MYDCKSLFDLVVNKLCCFSSSTSLIVYKALAKNLALCLAPHTRILKSILTLNLLAYQPNIIYWGGVQSAPPPYVSAN